MIKKSALIIIFLDLFCLPIDPNSQVLAGGYMLPYQTARGLALSNALTAGVDDPSAVFYNPAGLGEVNGNQLSINGSYINPQNSIENSGSKSTNNRNDNFLATFFANYHIPGTDFTVGIGTYTPFGLKTNYDNDAFTRFAAIDTELKTFYVTPAFSWHPSNFFSIGAGLSFVHASEVVSRALCFDPISGCTQPLGLEGRVRIADTDDAFAYNFGLLIKPTDTLKFGLSYRSRADLRFDNADAKFRGSFSTPTVKADVRPLSLPPVINAGVLWQINPSWGIEFVYEYTRWSEVKSLSATFSPVPVFLPLGAPVSGFSSGQDWKNTSTLRLGSFYRLGDRWEIRGGLGLEETPIPNRTLSPAIPGADLFTLNAGVGYKWRSMTIDLGYTAVFYQTRRITNSELEGLTGIPFLGAPGKDKYQNFGNLVFLSLGYRF